MAMIIRKVRPEDAGEIAEIYRKYVLESTVSFEEEAVSEEAMARRIAEIVREGYPFYVCLNGNAEVSDKDAPDCDAEDNSEKPSKIIGYAYAHRWKERAAYRFTAETTVYISSDALHLGIGTALMRKVITDCKTMGLKALIACITGGNEASIALHEKLGFRKVSHFEDVGFKFGRWLDVVDYELKLDEVGDQSLR